MRIMERNGEWVVLPEPQPHLTNRLDWTKFDAARGSHPRQAHGRSQSASRPATGHEDAGGRGVRTQTPGSGARQSAKAETGKAPKAVASKGQVAKGAGKSGESAAGKAAPAKAGSTKGMMTHEQHQAGVKAAVDKALARQQAHHDKELATLRAQHAKELAKAQAGAKAETAAQPKSSGKPKEVRLVPIGNITKWDYSPFGKLDVHILRQLYGADQFHQAVAAQGMVRLQAVARTIAERHGDKPASYGNSKASIVQYIVDRTNAERAAGKIYDGEGKRQYPPGFEKGGGG